MRQETFGDNSWDGRGWNRKKERHTYSTVLEGRTKLREHCGLVCGWRAEQRRSSSTVHQRPLQLHHQSSLLLTGPVVEVENRQSATIERVRLEWKWTWTWKLQTTKAPSAHCGRPLHHGAWYVALSISSLVACSSTAVLLYCAVPSLCAPPI
jgi:hypothetical protein